MVSTVGILTSAVLASGGVVALAVGYVAWQRRDHPAAEPLAKMSVFPGLAGFCYAVLAVTPTLLTRPLLAAANWLIAIAPAYFLLFTIAYTGRDHWLTRRRRGTIVGVFILSASLAAVEPLVMSPVSVSTIGGLTLPVVEDGGLVTLVAMAVSYPAILTGFGLLGTFLLSPRNMYRKQTAVIILAVLFTALGNLVFEAGLSPHPGLNLTSVFFAFEVITIALALFHYEFLNVEPLAPEIVLEEVDDPVLVLDDDDVLVDANPAARQFLDGRDPIGVPIEEAFPGLLSAAESSAEYVPDCREGRTDGGGGDLAVYDLNEAPIRDQYDRDRGTVVVLRDITLLKQRERTLESLQSVSQRFLAADTAEEVLEIAVRTADEVLDYPYSGAMLYDEEANLLRPAAFADSLAAAFESHDADADPVVEPGDGDVWQVFERGEPMVGKPVEAGEDGEIPVDIGGSLMYPLGEHGVLGVSAAADHDGFSDDDLRFAEILAGTTENALDRVQKEAQLRESRELLAERNEQIEFFNSVLRHDLLNGMMVVEGHTEMLEDLVEGEAADHVETIDEWTDDITNLAQKVRSVTKTITGERDVQLRPVDLSAAVEEKTAKVAAGYDVEVATDVPDGLRVRGDELVGTVVENVLNNAVEHNDASDPEVVVRARERDDRVEVRVADNGPGIPDGMKETVFEEDVTAEGSGSVGFGLYFVRVMMDIYGGDAWFEDNDPRGAVAVLSFPTAGVTRESPSARHD